MLRGRRLQAEFGLVSLEGCFPLAPSFDHAGPMGLSVGVCEEMLAILAPGFEPQISLGSLADLSIGVAWSGHTDPLLRARVGEVAACFGAARDLDVPFADDLVPIFMREVAEVHRDIYAEHHDLYGQNVGTKVARCLEVTDGEVEIAVRARERYREHLADLFAGIDLLLTPTLPCVPPLATVDEIELRQSYIRFTIPFNAIGAPALALPAGTAEGGLPASVQLVGPPGGDALVLAAGRRLEAAGRRPQTPAARTRTGRRSCRPRRRHHRLRCTRSDRRGDRLHGRPWLPLRLDR